MNKHSRPIEGLSIPEYLMITPTYVFFLINAMQVGVGILGFETYIARYAGFDAWISILISGVCIHVLVWMIYHILQDSKGDIVSVHRNIFGKYFGGFLSMLLSLYFLMLTLTVLRSFIEVIEVWIFPELQLWLFTFVFVMIVYYFVASGFRVVTGVCLISVVLGLPILLLKFFPIMEGDVMNLYPVVDHSIGEILGGTKQSVLSFLGFELLLVFYPFIKNPHASKSWAHFAVFFTVSIYLITAITSFIYFSEGQLQYVIWGTITLWKIVEFPFIERFEYIGIAMWFYVVLPNIALALWSASRIPKRVLKIKQKYVLALFSITLVVVCSLFTDRQAIDTLNSITSRIGFYILLYIPILFVLSKIMVKVRNRDEI
ncbi:GerAB/ArcD/ProY family transporter [Halobacillus naozhouensis]|uniref:GerAB/ArcD/ProY family transporter n=1 Tax=Halobacillus naozhouensis TaxID=554880 RepID=A0ABY8J2E9_9BACI|nr:GerAB/ArcD/ProY family transporter [Halobacillus naozhouensis]WFT75131.1 GerAB/ArcD/ProY family transporter [Halobacillus naozhouensis]